MDKTDQLMNLSKSSGSIFLTVALIALAACAQLPGTADKEVTDNSTALISTAQPAYRNLLAFTQDFPKLSLEAQRKDLTTLNQTAAQNAHSKLRLAMAYGLPNSRLRDTNKAQALLEEVIADKRLDEESLILAAIMHDYISELNKSAQKTRDEQKRADATQLKLDELQKKLDDLKRIEKTMVDRDQGVRK